MIDTKTNIELLKITSAIMDLFDNRDEMPNGDFQSCLEAQIMTAYYLGQSNTKNKILADLYKLNTNEVQNENK